MIILKSYDGSDNRIKAGFCIKHIGAPNSAQGLALQFDWGVNCTVFGVINTNQQCAPLPLSFSGAILLCDCLTYTHKTRFGFHEYGDCKMSALLSGVLITPNPTFYI